MLEHPLSLIQEGKKGTMFSDFPKEPTNLLYCGIYNDDDSDYDHD